MKIHLLATDRGEGKTKWLFNQVTKIEYELSIRISPETRTLLVLVPVQREAESELRSLKGRDRRIVISHFDGIDRVCRGHHFDSVFIDEYQKLTPRHWADLKMHMPLNRVENMYLAGDHYFTLDQLSRDPNDTEYLYRRLADQEHEINRLKQRG